MAQSTCVFDNLLREIEAAETKLAGMTPFMGSGAKLLDEDISLLPKSKGVSEEHTGACSGAGDGGDLGLHYYSCVGELEKENGELRKMTEMNKLAGESNQAEMIKLRKMIAEQKTVVNNLEKEISVEGHMEDTGTEEANGIVADIKANKQILDELKASFREVIDSQMRTETETGVGELLQLLWRQFVSVGPEADVQLSQLGLAPDPEDVERLVQAGLVTRRGDTLSLVNYTCGDSDVTMSS